MIDIVNGLTTTTTSSSQASSTASPFANSASGGGGDPITQIEAILNAHLGSLQWIDGAVKDLEGKVKQVEQGRFGAGYESETTSESDAGAGGTPRRGYGLGRR